MGVERLCLGLETDRPTLDAAAQRLMDRYRYERRGIRLLRLDASYQLCSAPEQADCIRRTLEGRKPARLSQPALEVLAIIAYYQPVTRAYVDQIRGVDSAYTVGLLLERELIEEHTSDKSLTRPPAGPGILLVGESPKPLFFSPRSQLSCFKKLFSLV